jgi:hypothetical protein
MFYLLSFFTLIQMEEGGKRGEGRCVSSVCTWKNSTTKTQGVKKRGLTDIFWWNRGSGIEDRVLIRGGLEGWGCDWFWVFGFFWFFLKKFLKYPLSEISKDICGSRQYWSCETKHRQNDDITFARRFARWLCDVRATPVRRKCKKSKNRQKTKKLVFFKFLTRVKLNTCKKWDVGSTYTPL